MRGFAGIPAPAVAVHDLIYGLSGDAGRLGDLRLAHTFGGCSNDDPQVLILRGLFCLGGSSDFSKSLNRGAAGLAKSWHFTFLESPLRAREIPIILSGLPDFGQCGTQRASGQSGDGLWQRA
ncbi:hypothetical protein ARUE_113p00520 (plasmid) [Arthrobacter sp. Rue61a]|nr:hypothetical protein ARUE_113p00520 [Arthrobacter sp. Rue61a]